MRTKHGTIATEIEKVVSVWQPWASLIAKKLKGFETRNYAFKYRGPLVIHAAKRWTKQQKEVCQIGYFPIALKRMGLTVETMPLGAIVGIVDWTAVYPTGQDDTPIISFQEEFFGDFGPNRFMWQLENPQVIQPFCAKGSQGLWNLNKSQIERVKQSLPQDSSYLIKRDEL